MSVKNALGYNQFPCPVGSIVYYGGLTNTGTPLGESVPMTFLIANGASLLRTEYVALYNVLGTTFGAVDSSHFTLPDLVTYKYIQGATTPNGAGASGGVFPTTLTIPSEAYIPTLSSALFTFTSWSLSANINSGSWVVPANEVRIINSTGANIAKDDGSSNNARSTTFSGTVTGNVGYNTGGGSIPIVSTYTPESLGLVPLIKSWYELIPSPLYVTPVNLGEPVPADNIYSGNPELSGFVI